MIQMYLRTFIIKVLFFISIKPPFFKKEVDTQQLYVPELIITKQYNLYQYNFTYIFNIHNFLEYVDKELHLLYFLHQLDK